MNFQIAPKSTEVKLNWEDAKLYCFSLNIDGKTGWRVPSVEELKYVMLNSDKINTTKFYLSLTPADKDNTYCSLILESNYILSPGRIHADAADDVIRPVRTLTL